MLVISSRDKVRNEEVSRRTGLKDVMEEIACLKWRWLIWPDRTQRGGQCERYNGKHAKQREAEVDHNAYG